MTWTDIFLVAFGWVVAMVVIAGLEKAWHALKKGG